MRRTLFHIVIGVVVVVAVEAALAAASVPSGIVDFRDSLGLWLTVTGGFILAGSFLALLGPTTHASSWSIGPLTRTGRTMPGGGLSGGVQGILVSSGTRSLWDFSRSPGLYAPQSKVLAPIGIGSVLFVLGALLALI